MPIKPDLQRHSRETLPVFDLTLDNGELLQELEVVRRVPGKRIVCRGNWNGQLVYAKLFIGKNAAKYAARDARGARWLAAAQIATPTLLLETSVASLGCHGLLYAAVAGENAEQVWDGLDIEGRYALALRLVGEIARHHQAGLLQTDLYLKNFLVQGQQIYTLDGDGIRRLRMLGRGCQQRDNLARLLSKIDVVVLRAWLPGLLRHYASVIETESEFYLDDMQRRIAQYWQYDMRQYAEKVQRTCSDVVTWQDSSVYAAVNRVDDSPALRAALASPDALFEQQGAQRLKSGNTCTVAAVQIDQRKLVVKRYNIKNFWHGLGRAWRPSRAVQAWSHAYRLRLKDIATPAPVAVMERRAGRLRQEAYLLTEYVEARDAAAFFADVTISVEQRQQVALAIASMFHQLFCLRLEHGDCKASNVLVQGLQPMLIDLDSMRQHACLMRFRRRHVRDLRRFMKNWQSDAVARHLLGGAFRAVYTDKDVLDQAGIK